MSKNDTISFLFIHGAGGTKSKWRALTLPDGKNKFVDLPGHGTNKAKPCESIEDYAKALADEISEDCIVVGHSMGGLIAIELAALHPKVKGIVLAASSYQLPVHPKIIATLAEGTFPESLFRASYGKEASSDLLKEEQQELEKSPVDVALNDFQACDRYKRGEARFQTLEKPVLAVLGSEDRLIPPNTTEELKRINPNIAISVIEGAGHYVALEKPDPFVKEILQFRQTL